MQRLFRVVHERHNAGQLQLLENKLVPAESPVEALFLASGNALQFESTFLSSNSASIERHVNGVKDVWQASYIHDGVAP